MKTKRIKKLIAFLLVFAILLSSSSTTIIAVEDGIALTIETYEETTETTDEETEEDTSEEIIEDDTEEEIVDDTTEPKETTSSTDEEIAAEDETETEEVTTTSEDDIATASDDDDEDVTYTFYIKYYLEEEDDEGNTTYTLLATKTRVAELNTSIASYWYDSTNFWNQIGLEANSCKVRTGIGSSYDNAYTAATAKTTRFSLTESDTSAFTHVRVAGDLSYSQVAVYNGSDGSYTYSNSTSLYKYGVIIISDYGVEEYTVTYNSNLSSVSSNYSDETTTDTVASDDSWTVLDSSTYSLDGYVLSSWNTESDGSGTAYGAGATYDEGTLTGDLTLYAQWEPISYTISFNGNGSTSGSMSSITAYYDTEYTLTENSYTKTGYTFTGWNTESDGSGTSYDDEETISNLTTTDGDTITLYAQWEVNSYNLNIYYIDYYTGEVLDKESIEMEYGDEYTTNSKDIDGYTLYTDSGNTSRYSSEKMI